MSERQSIPERLGHDFLRALYHTINAVRIYKNNNQIVQASVSSFQNMLNELTISGDISLLLYRNRFHLVGEKIRYRREMAVVVFKMAEFFSKRGIGGVNFLKSSREVMPENIMTFIRLFNDSIRHENSIQWLEQKLGEQDFSWVQIFPRQDDDATFDDENLENKRYEKARKHYFLAIEAVKEVANKVSQGMVGIRKSIRLAQNIVDLIQEDTTLMIGLTTLREYDDYTYSHSVNVALLATCLGRHIGLSDTLLEHLTLCGLFHDLGKVDIPKEILFKHWALTDGEWNLLKAHPVMGVRKILMLNANPSLRSRIILGPFEHHLNVDMTGYPRTMFTGHLSLMGKIIHITDVYEAMTNDRVYRPKSFTPDEVLRKMWQEAGKMFDTILLKRFIHMMGTLPLVLLLEDDGNGTLQRGEMVYLADQIIKDGSDHLNIVRVIPSAQLNILPVQFFLRLK
jgi:HD-GYP domain-containing protein (c-di-GMP phosphodiesterase class II)